MRGWWSLPLLVLVLTTHTARAQRPFFKQGIKTELLEDIAIGSEVGTLVANDFRDTRSRVRYDVESDKFTVINKLSGVVRLLKTLDRETSLGGVVVKQIAIFYDRTPPERIEKVVQIQIMDVNDNVPQFTKKQFKFVVSEDAPLNTLIAERIEIKDADLKNSNLEVACIPEKAEIARSCEIFEVKMISHSNFDWYGNIILKDALNFEEQALWQLPLEVYDGELTLAQTIEILVQDVQDTPPQWLDTYSVVVNESIPVDSYIETVVAEDGDRGVPRPIIYRISRNIPVDGSSRGWFKIDENTGVITTDVVLDRDDPLLAAGFVDIKVQAIEVIDAARGIYGTQDDVDRKETTVTITVLDLNDHGPRWVIGTPSVDVREDIASGRPVPGLLATVIDEDQGDRAFHTIIQLDHADKFSFSPEEGTSKTIIAFRVIQSLDFEVFRNTDPKYTIRLVARETRTVERLSSTGTVTITVVDVNDNKPEFTRTGNYQIAIREDTPIGTSVLNVEANDADSGDLGKPGLRYSLIGNGAEKFNMDPITGDLTVANCAPDKPGEGECLDYERESLYLLTVLAEDELGTGRRDGRGIVVTVLDANDNRPKCRLDKYVGYIREGETSPDPPLQILARDLDSSNSQNNLIFYTVVGDDRFIISSTGNITAVAPIRIDQTGKVIDLDIEVKDAIGGEICKAQVNIIDVNDHTPVFTSNGFYNVTIPETSPPGTEVVDVDASDNDPPTSGNGQLASYRIDSGALGKFRIDPTSGLITVAQGATFDADLQTQYYLTVIAPDRGSPPKTGSANVIVNIIDKNNKSPYFIPSVQRIPVWENTTLNTYIIGLIAQDPDPGAKLEYSWTEPITALDPRRNPVDPNTYNFKNLFSIDKNDGTVRLANPLDYDTTAEITLTAQAQDTTATEFQVGKATLIINVLDINENPPTFARPWTLQTPDYNISVKEEQPVPSFVMTAVANDPNSPISAYVLSENNGGYFRISKLTGVVESILRLDYEKIQSLDFQVTAYDFGVPVLSATANVHVTIVNINDMTPQFGKDSYEVTIDENSPAGTDVVTVTATDGDSGHYGEVSYLLSSHSDQFQIDNKTGKITVKDGAILDREATPYITVQVTAEDSPLEPEVRNRNSVPVYITLRDLNDHVPAFINDDYFAEIIENTPVGTSVLRVEASDGDKSCNCANALLAYEKITGDTSPGYFKVQRDTGLIEVATSVMGKAYDHKFTVQVNDEDGSGPVPREARVTIRVVRANNKPPVWIIPPENNMTIDVLENQYLGMVVYEVQARDEEAGARGNDVSYFFRYENQNVDRTPEFRINEITGVIHARQIYDREAISLYRLYLVASDKGNPPFNSTRILTVRIRDVDDNKPEFPLRADGSTTPYNFIVRENAAKDTYIGTIQATDRDSADYGKIYYSIVSGNTDNTFYIKNTDNKGELFTNKAIDRETAGFYSLEVRASNNASSQYLITRRKRAIDPSAVNVRISVSDTNDNVPVFSTKLYQTCISSDDPFGKSLLTVGATDLDTGESGTIRFTVSGIDNVIPGARNPVSDAFIVGEVNGTVYSNSLYTQYQNTYFELAMVAANPNSPPGQTGKSTVQVFVTNPLDMVKVVAHRGPEEVNRYISDYKQTLSESTNGGIICIDDIRYHLGDAVEIDKSDIYIHVIDSETKQSMAAVDVAAKLQKAKAGTLGADFHILFIEEIGVVNTGEERFEVHPVFILTMIILFIIICACVVLCVVCFFIRRSYKNEMERAKYIHEEPLFANGASVNPLWKEKPEEKRLQGFPNRAYIDDEVAPPVPPKDEIVGAPVPGPEPPAPAPPAPPAGGPPPAPPPPPVA